MNRYGGLTNSLSYLITNGPTREMCASEITRGGGSESAGSFEKLELLKATWFKSTTGSHTLNSEAGTTAVS